MAYEHKDNSGSMWPNDKKTSDKHPDLKGQCKVNGVTLDVAGWDNKDGRVSLKFSVPQSKSDRPRTQAQPEPQRREPAPF